MLQTLVVLVVVILLSIIGSGEACGARASSMNG
jgi:hypothetical protein